MLSEDTIYIDIHTHQTYTDQKVLSIKNYFPTDLGTLTEDEKFTVGIHPWYIQHEYIDYEFSLMRDATLKPTCLGIGEAGFDKFSGVSIDVQETVFRKQIELSEKVKKPLFVHCVRFHNELLRLRNAYQPIQPWVIHGYNNSLKIASDLNEAGCLFSFGEALLYSDSNASKLIAELKPQQFFLETDEKTIHIADVYQAAARLLNISLNQLMDQQNKNYIQVFG